MKIKAKLSFLGSFLYFFMGKPWEIFWGVFVIFGAFLILSYIHYAPMARRKDFYLILIFYFKENVWGSPIPIIFRTLN
jgi:hypothetical protein